jgi:hypothetical protein
MNLKQKYKEILKLRLSYNIPYINRWSEVSTLYSYIVKAEYIIAYNRIFLDLLKSPLILLARVILCDDACPLKIEKY